jgi:hypothetical protein
MKRIIAITVFVFFALFANAAIITNVQRLSLFGITNYLSPTGLVAVAPFFNGADHLKGMPADSFLRTAGSNVLLEITNFVKSQDTIVSNGVVTLIINTSNSLFNVSVLVSNGVINQLIVLSNNLSSAGFARLEVQTNSVRLGLITNLNWTYGITGSVSSATAILGVDDSVANIVVSNGLVTFTLNTSNSIFNLSQSAGSNLVVVLSGTNTLVTMTSTNGTNFYTVNSTASGGALSGSTNFMNLSVQAAKLPLTNYPTIDAGWQDWELLYYRTNDAGANIALDSSWQVVIPPDYATNSLRIRLLSSITATNGPNSSNTIFRTYISRFRPSASQDLHTNSFIGPISGTNTWAAVFDGTNKVQSIVISWGTNSLLMPGDLALLKVERDGVNDTYVGATALVGLQVEYTR